MMALHLKAILGPMLLDQPLEGVTTSLPSPEVQSGYPEGREGNLAGRPMWVLTRELVIPSN